MGNCFNAFGRKDIISEKSLIAVRNVIEYLKEDFVLDIIQRDIFRATVHDQTAQQIARELTRGGPGLYRLLEESTVRDIASGLMIFLMYLKKPLIPPHIQAIVLDPDNKTVCPEIVAQDVLGLINQEIQGRQFKLLQYTLDLLNHVLKYTPTDELSGSNVPIYMMPIFFNLQAEHLLHWRRVATIFVELIRLAPVQLNIIQENNDNNGANNMIVQNLLHSDDLSRSVNVFLQQRLLDMQLILRRYLREIGNRGDSTCIEIYQLRNRLHSQRHRS